MFPNSNMLNQSAVDALYSATYLEDYLDSVDSLPDDLQRHMTRLKEIDLVIQSYFREVSGSMKRLLELMKDSEENPMEISRLQTRIQTLLISCQELGDEKIHVGQEINEAIENKNRQLELDRKNLDSVYRGSGPAGDSRENSLGQNNAKDERKRARRIRHETFIPSTLGPATLTPTLYNADGKCALPISIEPITQSVPKQSTSAAPYKTFTTEDRQSNSSFQNASNSASNVLSQTTLKEKKETQSQPSTSLPKKLDKRAMEVQQIKRSRRRRQSLTKPAQNPIPVPTDPDEPTYCLCDQVSYGEMIGCDNDLCPIEWFHFSCVSLSTKPKGKWFCPKCRGDRPNQMKPKNIFLKELETYNKEKEEKT